MVVPREARRRLAMRYIATAADMGFSRWPWRGKGSGGPFYVWDVVPTILFTTSLPIDPRMDGKPIVNAFESELIRRREKLHVK